MSQDSPKTGLRGLDADLRSIFESNALKRRQEIKDAIANHSLTKKELFEVAPEGIMRFARVLKIPASYQAVLERVREDSRPHMEKAKEIVERHFMMILDHPAVSATLATKQDAEDRIHERFVSDALKVVTNIRHMPSWGGQPPQMQPSSRVAFFGMDERLMLETLFEWDDYLFFAMTFVEMLSCEMESGKVLAEHGLTDVPYKAKMVDLVKKLEECVVRVKELGHLYGLQFHAPDLVVNVEPK